MSVQNLIETHEKHGNIYKDIETKQNELSTANDWLEKNGNSEDTKITAKFVPTQNKKNRLESELDALLAVLGDLEEAARKYLNSQRVAERSKEALQGIDTVLAGMEELKDIRSRFPKLYSAREELEKVKKDSANAVNLFQHHNNAFYNAG